MTERQRLKVYKRVLRIVKKTQKDDTATRGLCSLLKHEGHRLGINRFIFGTPGPKLFPELLDVRPKDYKKYDPFWWSIDPYDYGGRIEALNKMITILREQVENESK